MPLLLVGALASTCSPSYLDPLCSSYAPGRLTVTLAEIGLFTEDGSPIELPSARVVCSQGSSGDDHAQYRPEFGFGLVLVRGRPTLVTGSGVVLNEYECGNEIILHSCADPLRVRVTAPGCAPFDGSWSWDDNYRLNGTGSLDFHIPVRLHCSSDAGIGPSMRDIPNATPDLGDLHRETGTGADAGREFDASIDSGS